MTNDNLGNRMKLYEKGNQYYLTHRTPIIIRIDGKAFHSWTYFLKDPFDRNLIDAMNETAKVLCEEIQGAQCAYVQSDEISLLIHSYKTFVTQPWFQNQVQKMCSVSASIATAQFNKEASNTWGKSVPLAFFDSRVFTVPENDVCNYFLWRQQDCLRNSVQSWARSMFSHKQCDNKNVQQLKEMCADNGMPWEMLSHNSKFGRFLINKSYEHDGVQRSRWFVLKEANFKEDRSLINDLLIKEE